MRRLIVLAMLAFALPAGAAATHAASAFSSTDVTIPMDDGVSIAATLVEPSGSAGKLPAVLLLHGLGGSRKDLLPIADRFAAAGYAVLAPDFRGHGESGGLTSIDGPREIRDVRALYAWLANRPEVDGAHVGGWGISLGGGAILRALVEGVPFAAVETVETWTDLDSALAPGQLAKTGAIYALLTSVPPDRVAPEVLALKNEAFADRNFPAQRAFARLRSNRQSLSRIRTPVFMFQGRRDFVFDTAQAKAGLRLLKGPKRLYVGDFGHSPSTFPGPDVERVIQYGVDWFDRFLKPGSATPPDTVFVAPDPYRGSIATFNRFTLPATRSYRPRLTGPVETFGQAGSTARAGGTSRRLETFGAPVVRVSARFRGGWSHLVAVLTAKPPHGAPIVVSEGGVYTGRLRGWERVTLRLIDDVTPIPAHARLTLTLSSSSPDLLYLDRPMPRSARITVGAVALVLPVLRQPISR